MALKYPNKPDLRFNAPFNAEKRGSGVSRRIDKKVMIRMAETQLQYFFVLNSFLLPRNSRMQP
jgi:hypothetical protein